MVGFLAVAGVEGGGPLGQHRALVVALCAAIGGIQLAVSAVDVFQFLGADFVPLLERCGQFRRASPGGLLALVLPAALVGQVAALFSVGLLDEFPAENIVFQVDALGLVCGLHVLILARLARVAAARAPVFFQQVFEFFVIGYFPVENIRQDALFQSLCGALE
ncbi:hypothetical protein C662_18743 [Thauera sp. 28]|nr:hypothetical protein C662_18743 [Thauera sp. 28]